MAKENLYVDLDISFRAHPVTGNVLLKKDKAAISQSVKNLVLLNKYEDLFNSNLFTNVTGSLFELIGDVELVFIKNKIEATLNNFEPRATLLDVRYRLDKNDPNGFTFDIIYMPENAVEPETVNVFIERVR